MHRTGSEQCWAPMSVKHKVRHVLAPAQSCTQRIRGRVESHWLRALLGANVCKTGGVAPPGASAELHPGFSKEAVLNYTGTDRTMDTYCNICCKQLRKYKLFSYLTILSATSCQSIICQKINMGVTNTFQTLSCNNLVIKI